MAVTLFHKAVALCSHYYKDVAINENIVKLAEEKSYKELFQSIDELCGPKGYSEVSVYKNNYQVYLYFAADAERKAILPKLEKLFVKYKIKQDFDNWQFVDGKKHFCLKLSTNQSVALLGLDPSIQFSFDSAQEILKETKKASQNQWAIFPDEIITKILVFTGIPTIGRWAAVCTRFKVVADGEYLWRLIAEMHKIPIEQNGVDPKKQVEEDMVKYLNALVNLKPCNNSVMASYRTEKEISDIGGLILTPSCGTSEQYHGVILLKETREEGEKWLLHLNPGGGYLHFTEADYDRLLPIAMQKLRELSNWFQISMPHRWGDILAPQSKTLSSGRRKIKRKTSLSKIAQDRTRTYTPNGTRS